MHNKKTEINKIKDNTFMYLFGQEKAQLIKYVLKNKKFYQAEAARALNWSIPKAQYHLRRFVKHNLLIESPTKTRTYYLPNRKVIEKYTPNA